MRLKIFRFLDDFVVVMSLQNGTHLVIFLQHQMVLLNQATFVPPDGMGHLFDLIGYLLFEILVQFQVLVKASC